MPASRLALSAFCALSFLIGNSTLLAKGPGGGGGGGVRMGVSVGTPGVRAGVAVGGGGRGYYGGPHYHGPGPYGHYHYGYPYRRYGYPYAFGVGVGVGAAYAYPAYGYAPYYGYPAYAYPVYPPATVVAPTTVIAPTPQYTYDGSPLPAGVPAPSGGGVPSPPTPNAAMRIPDPGAQVPNQAAPQLAMPMQMPTPSPAMVANAKVFVTQGDQAFRKGDYNAAMYAWKHAAVDNPQDASVTMKLGQALFANGQFEEAAGATQGAMQQLPKESWGTIVRGYKQMYGNPQEYTRQLRVLEKAVQDKPENPALHFLAGYHYAYLGFTKESVDQLDKVLKLVPEDELARQLRDEVQGKTDNNAGTRSVEPPEALPVLPARIPQSKEGPALPGVDG